MKKNLVSIFLLSCAVTISVLFSGCGTSSINSSTPSVFTKVTGVASAGAPISGVVSIKDSSVPAQLRATTTAPDGSFTMDTSGLKPPFVLKVDPISSATSSQLYSLAEKEGQTNINPFSHAAVAVASDDDPRNLYDNADSDQFRRTADNFDSVIKKLMKVLAPLFQLYMTNQNPVDGDYRANHTGLDALFDDIRISVSSGTVTVTNKLTGGVIFTAPINNLSSGTFYPENMPGQPGQVNGATLYGTYCSSCHGPLATSAKLGATAAQIQSAIANNAGGNMGSLSNLSALQIEAIATALAGTPVTPPTPTTLTLAEATATCTPCHGLTVNGTVLRSGGYSMTGATASSFLTTINSMVGKGAVLAAGTTSQDYANFFVGLGTSTPPTCTSFTYSAWGTCQTDGTQTRTVLASSPAGCAGGTPVLSQSCTYVPPVTTCTSFTYSAWGTCQPDSTQTRTVASSSPAGCTGGTPVLTQACIYIPPVTTCTSFTYSAWGACQSNNTQSRTVLTSSPTGCTGGTPVLSQSCTYTPPATLTLAQVTSSCTSCHGLTVNTTVLKSGGYTVTGRTAATWLTTVNTMVGFGARLATGTTAQDYANFLAALP